MIDQKELEARAEAGGIAVRDVPLTEQELEWMGLQALLEVCPPSTSALEKAGPPSAVADACPIINIATAESPLPDRAPDAGEIVGLLRAANIARRLAASWRTPTDMIADAILEAAR